MLWGSDHVQSESKLDSLDRGSSLASVKQSQMPQPGVTAEFQGENRSGALTSASNRGWWIHSSHSCWKNAGSGFPKATFPWGFSSPLLLPNRKAGAIFPAFSRLNNLQPCDQGEFFFCRPCNQGLVDYVALSIPKNATGSEYQVGPDIRKLMVLDLVTLVFGS